ncbi:MAG: hypothetical protein ACI4QH_04670, partial [Candidatus Fimimonas sp.]
MKLTEKGYVCDRLSRGDKLLIGNGAYGYRGTLEENTAEQCVALNAACFYDQNGNNWRESVNMPNPLFCTVHVNGVLLDEKCATSHVEWLDLRNGTFHRETEFAVGYAKVKIISQRFFAQYRNDLLVSRFCVQAPDVDVTVRSGIDCNVWNISGEHFAVNGTQTNPLAVFCTTNEGKNLAVEVTEQASAQVAQTQFSQGKLCNVYNVCGNFSLTKFCRLSHDGLVWQERETNFDEILRKHNAVWKDAWKRSRVEICDQHNLQLAMDYSVYQLLIYAPKTEGMSVGARGLSGQTYKGAVFWDTEMFMLPFYLQTDCETAKRLVRYRIATLNGAREKARHYGFSGAFFAWESQDGADACSDFNVTDVFTGRPVRTYFKDKQIHISADIAVAVFNAYKATKDLSLLEQGGAELLLECALFYATYAYFNQNKNRFELLDVIGPDEYHERVNNNAYTN